MQKKCKISIKNFEIIVDLNNSNTANIIWGSLPIKSDLKTWGNELYFYTSIKADLEKDAKDSADFGEIAFWPAGGAIAIGFGKTPVSIGNEIRFASECNIWGQTKFNLKKLNCISEGETILISRYSLK